MKIHPAILLENRLKETIIDYMCQIQGDMDQPEIVYEYLAVLKKYYRKEVVLDIMERSLPDEIIRELKRISRNKKIDDFLYEKEN